MDNKHWHPLYIYLSLASCVKLIPTKFAYLYKPYKWGRLSKIMKTATQIEEICKKLKPVIGNRAENLWYAYLAEDEKGRRELALNIELIAEKMLKREALEKQKILLEPPSQKESAGQFFVGNVHYNDNTLHPLYLRREDFIKQIGIFAVTGEGKTNLAYLLALQLLQKKVPFLVIDWKRSWRNLYSLRHAFPLLKEIRVFTVGRDTLPFQWNPFRGPPGSDRELWISAIAEALEKSHLSGPGVAYYFNKVYSKLFRGLTGDFYPNFFDGLKEIEKIRAYERELKWKQTALRIFQSFTIGNAFKAFNKRDPVKLEELLDKPVIFELDLEMPKALRVFFSEVILRWIHLYRIAQGETENLRHVLFLEEAHNLFNQQGFYYKDTNNLENIYREVRAFGQGIVSITQHPSVLPLYLLGNCHTQIYLGLQHADDIRIARKALFLNRDEEPYLSSLRVGESIIKIKDRIDPCLVKIPLVPVKKGLVTDQWLRVNTPTYLPRTSDEKKAHHPGDLPGDNNRVSKSGKYPGNWKERSFDLLTDIHLNPLSSTVQRYKRLGLNPKYGNQFKNLLISQGCIQPRKIVTAKGWITLYQLTRKGQIVLHDLGYDVKDAREGIIHKFWKEKVAAYYRRKGYEVMIEEQINGRPDIIVTDGDKRIAIEIETGKSDAVANMRRNLAAGFDKVFCVATSADAERKIREDIGSPELKDIQNLFLVNTKAF